MEEQPAVENKALSASKIKVLEDCSWLYYCKYHLNLPDPSNLGAKMGTICHLVFECLLNPRHLKNYKKIIKKKSIDADKGCSRLVKKHMVAQDIDEPSNYLLIDQMIVTGLSSDFFVKNGELLGAEIQFDIKNDEPFYHIRGFMDKAYKVNDRVLVDDYKSSKAKFEGEDHESNLQAMMYSLSSKRLWPDLIPEVRFVFLRFKDEPMVKVKFNDNVLKGFEHYLAKIQQKVNNFDEVAARKGFAADVKNPEGFKGPIMCGYAKFRGQKKKDGNPMWHCPYKFPFKYFVLKDSKDKTIKSSFENNFKPKEGEKVLALDYTGCPKFRPPIDEF